MISSIPHKNIYPITLSLLFAAIVLLRDPSTVFASTARSTISRTYSTHMAIAAPAWHRPWKRLPYGRQENNQIFRGCANNTENKYYWGRNQGNSGNNGLNHGYLQDDSSNSTNQIINQSGFGGRRNNQLFEICSNNSFNFHYTGIRQGNSGNSGDNEGASQDNSVNAGNQIIN